MKYNIPLSDLQEPSTKEEILAYEKRHKQIKKRHSKSVSIRNARKQKDKWKHHS